VEEEVRAARVDAGKNNKDGDSEEKGDKKRKGMCVQEGESLVLPSKKMKETLETNNPITAQAMVMTLLKQQQIQQMKMALTMMNNQGMNNQMMNNQVMNNQMMKNQLTMMDPMLQWWRMHEVNVPGVVVNPVLAAQAAQADDYSTRMMMTLGVSPIIAPPSSGPTYHTLIINLPPPRTKWFWIIILPWDYQR